MTLLRLTVENVGLIARGELAFAPGLTVVTGETGSGKTMLLDGLALALGERVESDTVGPGADRARATLEIELDPPRRAAWCEAGFDLAGDDAVVQREVLAGGRSQARINGIPAAAGQLRALAGSVVDVVSQHAAQRLLAPAYALEVVDWAGGEGLLRLRDNVARLHREHEQARRRTAELADDDGRRRAAAAEAREALHEIDAAAIGGDDEDERLRERRAVLEHAERIVAALAAAVAALQDDGGAIDALGAAETALAGLARYGERFAELAGSAAALQSDTNELAAALARAGDGLELDAAELEAVGARLDAFDRLKRKYGGSLAAVRARRDHFARTVAEDDDSAALLAAARVASGRLEAELAALAAELSARRAAAAAAIEAAVGTELAALAMPAATLRIAFEPLPEPGPGGAERAELRFSAGPGVPERPLVRVASGGELSRVLLALIVVVADSRERRALVFDEIDAGIGGAAAAAVGARLARLAERGQVVCVTHLAQIAAYGDAHVALRKENGEEGTTISTVALAGAARRAEIARMLSGEPQGVALVHAAELLAARRRV